jgi:hypothetical protein
MILLYKTKICELEFGLRDALSIIDELVAAGIPKQDIVLGFQEPAVQKYTSYGVA